MKKNIIIGICAMVLLLTNLAVACSAPASPATKPADTEPAAVPEPLVLKTSMMYPVNHPYYKSSEVYADMVLKATNGRVKMVLHGSETLSPASQELTAVHTGMADAAVSVVSYLVGQVPVCNVGVLPWVFIHDRAKCAEAAMEALPAIQKGFAKYNVQLMWYCPGEAGYVLVTQKEVHVPDDAKGLKIRSGGGLLDKLVAGWGCSVISIPASEMYQSIQSGVADGTVLTSPTVISFKLNEICKYIMDPYLDFNALCLYINNDKWNKISKADQDAMNAIQKEFLLALVNMPSTAEARAAFPKLGFTVYKPEGDELKLWKAPAKQIWEDFMASSPEAKQAAEAYIKYGAGY